MIDKKTIQKFVRPSMFIIGKGVMASVAREASLKIKEMAYIHCEGYSAHSLKHGPFALMTSGFPVILIVDEENMEEMMNIYEQLCSRDANVYIISDSEEIVKKNNGIHFPRNNHGHLLCMVVLQCIAYSLCTFSGINPDRPRNLAKVVTV